MTRSLKNDGSEDTQVEWRGDKGSGMDFEVSYTATGPARRPFARCAMAATLPILLALIVPSIAGCTPHEPAAGNASNKAPKESEPVMLSITGYNYTSRHIESFSVNGQGGGNLYVSSPTSGGGGTVCCVRYRPGTKVRKVKVKWQTGACFYSVKSAISGEVSDTLHLFSQEREVEIDQIVPSDPQVMEVHFYPDGSIKAAITASESLPRLRLDAGREDKSRYPRCPEDEKPPV